MKKLVVLLLVSLMAASAMAQIDPDPNSIGIYFDETANDNCITVGTVTPFWAYICLTNTTVGQIGFYEFGYNFVSNGPPFTWVMQQDLPAGGLDETIVGATFDIGSGDAYTGDHIVAMGLGFPGQAVTVLHAKQFIMYAEQSVDMYLYESSQSSVAGKLPVVLDISLDPSEFFTCNQSTGGFDIPVAQVNPAGDCVVAEEAASFGSVKSLFR